MMEVTRSELLVNRLVDEEATTEDWKEFGLLAEVEPSLWRDLAELQHQRQALARGMDLELAIADDVELPITPSRWMSHPAAWAGWLVAAVLAVSWSLGLNGFVKNGNPDTNEASLGPSFSSSDEALNAYLDQGRREGVVLGELPTKVLLESNPVSNGNGYNVVYYRVIVERRRVPTLIHFEPARDEVGNPLLRPVITRSAGSM